MNLSEIIEVAIRDLYDGINSGDITRAVSLMDENVVRVEPEDFPTPGTYRGHAELKAHLESGRSTWAEGTCSPEKILVKRDKAVVLLHIHVRLKNQSKWIDARIADGFIFRNGKVLEMRSFAEKSQALKWAGLDD